MCAAIEHVRFTPKSDRKSGHLAARLYRFDISQCRPADFTPVCLCVSPKCLFRVVPTMRTEETIAAEKIRRKPFVKPLGICQDCGQPVLAGQEFCRTHDGLFRHALCFYEPAYAKHVREHKE